MSPLLKKLNYKEQQIVALLSLPKEQEYLISDFSEYAKVVTEVKEALTADFIISFCIKKAEVDSFATDVVAKLKGDTICWITYPKGSSKKYKCEFNRDNGWDKLGEIGYEPVRQIAIDEDWSALRFRKAEHIKTMTRSFAMSKEGKAKVAAGKKQ